MKSLLDEISNEKSISSEKLQLLKSSVVIKHIAKGEILRRKGEKPEKFYFVKKGCLRSYAIDEKGKEHIFMFAPEGWIIGDIESHVKNMPTQLFVDAIEDSEIEVFDKKIVNLDTQLLQPKLALDKLTKRVAVLQKRIILLMSATLQERYLDFIQTYPEIVQRVPQKMIASYLGVTPEALSKIRNDLSKHK